MGIIEQITEIKGKENLEEGRRKGREEATRCLVENLLKDSTLPIEKIASLTGISIESVRQIELLVIIKQVAERKRKAILKECRTSSYSEDYTVRFSEAHTERYEEGLRDGVDLGTRRIVENLLKDSTLPLEKIASVANISLRSVKGIKKASDRK